MKFTVKERLNIILAETEKLFRMSIFDKIFFAQVCHSSLRHPWLGASTFELVLLQLSIHSSHWIMTIEVRPPVVGVGRTPLLIHFQKDDDFLSCTLDLFSLIIYNSIISSSTVFLLASTYRSCTPSDLFCNFSGKQKHHIFRFV